MLYNESKHNILDLVGKANKIPPSGFTSHTNKGLMNEQSWA
jgi:hypothetical protein